MKHHFLHDKARIEQYLRRDAALHLYELGDLDNFFWPHTSWYGLQENGGIKSIALLYAGTELPVLLALGPAGSDYYVKLLESIRHLLPGRFYCHLTPGLDEALKKTYHLEFHGRHLKMTLTKSESLQSINVSVVERLKAKDETELFEFYKNCYPGNWFDPRMLESGEYFGIRQNGRLASVAGIHVYSRQYKVAALGNIATRAELRGQGLGRAATAALCLNLQKSCDFIGLNVKKDNAPAIRCYQQLGFTPTAEYDEYLAARF
ncbi:MAG: GNAT family N-acetyltransferase [Candidatus Edwardsbacteria bacterium]|nr:GNAT family N-acetyltransferase [Candidatus Edwardsbacteria bacterium]